MTATIINNDNSIYVLNGDAFQDTGPGSLTVVADGFIIEAGTAIAVDLAGGPWTITINGTVNSSDWAIQLSSPTGRSTLTVGKEGFISGTVGINADHPTDITNAGTILGGSGYAIGEDIAGNFKITNTGLIQDDVTDAILLGANGTHTIVNRGSIIANFSANAIATAGNSIEHVTNYGYIYFNVSLGDGDDTFSNLKKGYVVGNIDLGNGNDIFTGGPRQDVVHDAGGKDSYSLGAGGDVFVATGVNAADATDKVDGGAGRDEYNVTAANLGAVINLDIKAHGAADFPDFYSATYAAGTANSLDAGLDKIINFEDAAGGAGSDIIFGSKAANSLRGFGGADDLWGLGGHDTIDGGDGADRIIGGGGADDLTGGTGVDIFVFRSLADSGTTKAARDTIHDFEGAGVSGGDFIDLLPIDANTHNPGQDQFTLLASPNSKFGHHAGELRYIWQGSQTILQGDVNGDAKADFSIAFDGHLTFAAGDFLIVI